MRFMVDINAQIQVPAEQIPTMIGGFVDRWARHGDTWEAAGFFASGNGTGDEEAAVEALRAGDGFG